MEVEGKAEAGNITHGEYKGEQKVSIQQCLGDRDQ